MKSKESGKKGHRWVWAAVAIIVVLLFVLVYRIREVRHVPAQEIAPWALDTAVVKASSVSRGFPVLATVMTKGEVTITAQIPGTVLKMGPREGVAVKKGDFLGRIDTRELEDKIAGLQAKLAAAKAEVARQQDELKREEKLFQEGGSSETALEARRTAAIAARNNARALEREISALKVRRGYGEVVAPADGVISARLREPGDVCMPGHPLYRMTVAKGARVRVRLPQSIVEQISPGSKLELYHGSDTLVVQISRVYPSVDALALGAAEADLQTPPFGLASGARVSGRVILQEAGDALQVPPNAIITGEATNQSRVFKVVEEDGDATIKSIPVSVELVGQHNVAVHGDLSAGDRVIVAHESILLKLRDGDPVAVNEGGTR